MKKRCVTLFSLYLSMAFTLSTAFSTTVFADSGKAYLDKFMKYRAWSQNLPTDPDPEFLAFIDQNTPLSRQCREKWLYDLARRKAWHTYHAHYQPSSDQSLQCDEQWALYQEGQPTAAIQSAQQQWLNGHSEPKACHELYTYLIQHHEINDDLITQRIKLALEANNLSLAIALLKQYSPPRLNEVLLLNNINQHPSRIATLQPSELHSEFYLYGLKRMVSINMKQAIDQWLAPQTKAFLNHAQTQAFIAHVALYKAMRNQADAPLWFSKVEPTFYNDTLLDWQIRFALTVKQWPQVEMLINQSKDKDTPAWQYWLARALYAQGKKAQAISIYQSLASMRNYYGFLASQQLNKNFSFQDEPAIENKQLLLPYQPLLDEIKTLYASNQTLAASRLLNDFVLELPKDEQSALAYWLAHELQWYGKSVYLSNNEILNHQLTLRFPLAYATTIATYAKEYQIPSALIYAMIRQESAFREDAISAAGAKGLMQLMPSTAQVVAKEKKIHYNNLSQLVGSEKNIHLGTAYLQQLAKRYNNQFILMVAAYNAGPKQVAYWLKNHPLNDMDIWIETLPWHETRNYLKNVIAFYAVYKYRLQEKPRLTPFMWKITARP